MINESGDISDRTDRYFDICIGRRIMVERIYETPNGSIHYYISTVSPDSLTLVFLPGLTADHRLFDKQIDFFEGKYNILTWDAPAHAASRPFDFSFSLADKARWLEEILAAESIEKPVIVGQSMGGYVGQMYSELYPQRPAGFIVIDSAPLQRKYMTSAEIWMLKHTRPLYRAYPWKALLRDGSRGCAETEYGRELMKTMMMTYDGQTDYYVKLVSHGYRILAEAVEADLPYRIACPLLLICGEKDKAGSSKAYNRKWSAETGYTLHWIPGAGHNSNTDAPDIVNSLIKDFTESLNQEAYRATLE